MRIRRVIYSQSFAKKINRFSAKEKKIILQKITLFWENPFNPSLKTHKLKGKLSNFWSFSISFELRIMFRFGKKSGEVEFIDIGTHEIYR